MDPSFRWGDGNRVGVPFRSSRGAHRVANPIHHRLHLRCIVALGHHPDHRFGTRRADYQSAVARKLRFRGRELSHQQLGMNLLRRVQDDTAEVAKIEAYPRMEGRQMLMVLSPK